jgi:Leucine-rich repeat (LRR) protein
MLFIVTLALLSQCDNNDPNPYVNIPDNNFLDALIVGIDRNRDGKISLTEAEAITFIYVVDDSISDLTGIEKFVNLDTLFCSSNQLTFLDLTSNTKLKYLNCRENRLVTLIISNNAELEELDCSYNNLTNLDVSGFTILKNLRCANNQLTNLNVSYNTLLEELDCFNTQLSSLDVSNNTVLDTFWCGSNQLATLDVSNNTNLTDLQLGGMPTLYEVCVWETFFISPDDYNLVTTGGPNVYFTTDCN